MDQNTSSSGSSSSLFQLNIDVPASFMLRSAASWSKAMAIIGIIMGIIFFVIAFLMQGALNSPGSNLEGLLGERGVSSSEKQFAVTFYTILLVVIGLIFLISGLFGISFSNKISAALRTNDQNVLRSGFAAARNMFAFRTIIMIIWLLILLIMLFGIINDPGSGDGGRFD